MNCYEFLSKVLPCDGVGCFVGTYKKTVGKLWNVGYETIQALSTASIQHSERLHTAYYALGVFTDNYGPNKDGKDIWQRRAAQAVAFKTFAIDVDCGDDKPYKTQREGATALFTFIKKTGLPMPMIVSSGNGLHCYWPLTAHIMTAQWVETATKLKALCVQHEFFIDPSKVCDASMVLRPVGTTNFKGGKTVTLLKDAGPFEFSEVEAALKNVVSITLPQIPKPAKQLTRKQLLAAASNLLAGSNYAPADSIIIEQNCAQLRHAIKDDGKDTDQSRWYFVGAGIATGCENPEETFFRWSKGHPDFTEAGCRDKLDQWNKTTTGPVLCSRLDEKFPGVCGQCDLWGKIVTPCAIGNMPKHLVIQPPEKPGEPDAEFVEGVPVPFANFSGSGYERNEKTGYVFTTANGTGGRVMICEYDLFPCGIVHDPKTTYAESIWYWNKPYVGYVKAKIRMANIFNPDNTALLGDLSDNGILTMTIQSQSFIGAYMKGYIRQLQIAQATANLHNSFGWKDNFNKFIFGTTEFARKKDGTVTEREIGVSKVISDKGLDLAMTISGEAEPWIKWTRVLDDEEMAGHAFALGVGFAAPLVALSGLSGGLVSLLGSGGEGKSMMQTWQNSIYGNPKRLAMGNDDTKAAIVERMGMLANFPVTIDEMSRIDPARISDLTYWTTRGQDRNRQTTAIANNWATLGTASTNHSLRDKISSDSGDTTAINMRLLEFTFKKNKVFDDRDGMGRPISLMLESNYGSVGRAYIPALLRLGAVALREAISATERAIEARYGHKFTGTERYWALEITLVALALRIAHNNNLIQFDPERPVAWAMAQLSYQRGQVESRQLDSYDMISEYINENNGASLTIFYNNGKAISQEPFPRGEVRIRKELYLGPKGVIQKGFLFLDKYHFARWLVKGNYDMKKVMETVDEDGATFRPNKQSRIYMGKDSPLKLGQVSVVGLDMSHDRLSGMLEREVNLSVVPADRVKEIV